MQVHSREGFSGVAESSYVVDDDDPDFPSDRVWRATEVIGDDIVLGGVIVTFDKERFYNLFRDFPHEFTPEQIHIIKEALPYWYDFFKSRLST